MNIKMVLTKKSCCVCLLLVHLMLASLFCFPFWWYVIRFFSPFFCFTVEFSGCLKVINREAVKYPENSKLKQTSLSSLQVLCVLVSFLAHCFIRWSNFYLTAGFVCACKLHHKSLRWLRVAAVLLSQP